MMSLTAVSLSALQSCAGNIDPPGSKLHQANLKASAKEVAPLHQPL
jgi:hypothetical protein